MYAMAGRTKQGRTVKSPSASTKPSETRVVH